MAAYYAPEMASPQQRMAAAPQGTYLPAPYFAAAPVQQFFAQPAYAQQVMDPNGADEMRTVFISNFPCVWSLLPPAAARGCAQTESSRLSVSLTSVAPPSTADTKERELNNLCRFIPQYEVRAIRAHGGKVP